MKRIFFTAAALCGIFLFSCDENKEKEQDLSVEIEQPAPDFEYVLDQFADLRVLLYKIPGRDQLDMKQQKLCYYLAKAGLKGRDIMWDQNYRHNLTIRKALENIYRNYSGDRNSDNWKNFEIYLKRIWFSNGIHHHYSNDKIKPEFSEDYLNELLSDTGTKLEGEAFEVIFNDKDAKKVDRQRGADNVLNSAVNFYGPDVTDADVESFYAAKKSPDTDKPLALGLNSKLVKKDGKLVEEIYKSGGLYGEAIDKIIGWLEKAQGVAENKAQGDAIGLLIEYYKTGDLQTWDDYNIAWTQATEGNIDYINGFIEVYNDPVGYRGSFESIVQITDFDMSEKMAVLSENAQWFEDNSPIMDEHRKKDVV